MSSGMKETRRKVEPEHVCCIEESFCEDGLIKATCSCGWVGPERENRREANSDLTEHYQSVKQQGSS